VFCCGSCVFFSYGLVCYLVCWGEFFVCGMGGLWGGLCFEGGLISLARSLFVRSVPPLRVRGRFAGYQRPSLLRRRIWKNWRIFDYYLPMGFQHVECPLSGPSPAPPINSVRSKTTTHLGAAASKPLLVVIKLVGPSNTTRVEVLPGGSEDTSTNGFKKH